MARQREQPPERVLALDNLAYVIYMSGSTGLPKGVQVSHRGIGNLVYAQQETFGVTTRSRELQFSSLSFDASVFEIVMALLVGATLCLAPQEDLLPGADLVKLLREQAITLATLPPSALAVLPEETFPDLETIIVAGEACSRELVARWARGRRFFNAYGPTETTIWASVSLCQIQEEVTIGRPISNTELYVLNQQQQPVPVGVAGELYIGGIGLARGYNNRGDLTAERFVVHPWSSEPGARLYRTGDRVRYREDGQIEFLGRMDAQVKVRGYRIELGEIETVLTDHPAIREVVVLLHADGTDIAEKILIAYVVCMESLTLLAEDELRQYVREKIPSYMVPSCFIFLQEMPLMPNGKVDRSFLQKALLNEEQLKLALSEEHNVLHRHYIPPRDKIEFQLVQIWEDVLHTQQLSILENFFDLGGHSVSAIRLMSCISKCFGRELPLSTLFQLPTIAELAKALRERELFYESDAVLVTLQSNGVNRPFFCVHPAGGNVFCYTGLASLIGSDQPFYGLQMRDWSQEERYPHIEDMAAHYIDAIRSVQPQGPYLLGGWSFGGIVAFEMAQQLRKQGQKIALLALIDSGVPSNESGLVETLDTGDETLMKSALRLLDISVPQNLYTTKERLIHVYQYLKDTQILPDDADIEHARRFLFTLVANQNAAHMYTPQVYSEQITFFRAEESLKFLQEHSPLETVAGQAKIADGWEDVASGGIDGHLIKGSHESIVVGQDVSSLALALRECIEKVR